MLTHQCAECGKKLSGSAAACPKCGAQKPSNGWEKANNRPWEIVKILLGIGAGFTHQTSLTNNDLHRGL